MSPYGGDGAGAPRGGPCSAKIEPPSLLFDHNRCRG